MLHAIFGHSTCSSSEAPSVSERGQGGQKQFWVVKCTAASNANGKSGGDGVLSQNIFSTLESEESDNKASNPR